MHFSLVVERGMEARRGRNLDKIVSTRRTLKLCDPPT